MPPIAFKYFALARRRVDISRTKFVLPLVLVPNLLPQKGLSP